MADNDLMDLFSQAISQMAQPTYAQARYTQTPIIFGNDVNKTEGGMDPGEGRTYTPSQANPHSGMTLLDKMSLMLRNPHAISAIQNSPTNKGMIYVTPGGPGDDAYTLRHEATHNLLDVAGLGEKDYQKVMDSLPPDKAQQLRDLYNQSSRAGWSGNELPAYLNAYNPQSTGLNVPKNLRDLYLTTMDKYLSTKDPRRARQFKQMRISRDQ